MERMLNLIQDVNLLWSVAKDVGYYHLNVFKI